MLVGHYFNCWANQVATSLPSLYSLPNSTFLPGSSIRVASSSVVEPNAAIGVSNTLRSALVGWSKTLAGEVGRDGITVNLLLPGRIGTERLDELDAAAAAKQNKTKDEVRAAIEAATGEVITLKPR